MRMRTRRKDRFQAVLRASVTSTCVRPMRAGLTTKGTKNSNPVVSTFHKNAFSLDANENAFVICGLCLVLEQCLRSNGSQS